MTSMCSACIYFFFFFSSRRRHTRSTRDWSSDVCSSDLLRNGYLYYATPTSIERFKLNPGELKPAGPAEVIVGGFPAGPNRSEERRVGKECRCRVWRDR